MITPEVMLERTIRKDFEVPPLETVASVPKEISDIVQTLLQSDPNKRTSLKEGNNIISLATAKDVAIAIKEAMVQQDPALNMEFPYYYIKSHKRASK